MTSGVAILPIACLLPRGRARIITDGNRGIADSSGDHPTTHTQLHVTDEDIMSTPAGWFPQDDGQQRYWDGSSAPRIPLQEWHR
jgi:hypothetical protein